MAAVVPALTLSAPPTVTTISCRATTMMACGLAPGAVGTATTRPRVTLRPTSPVKLAGALASGVMVIVVAVTAVTVP